MWTTFAVLTIGLIGASSAAVIAPAIAIANKTEAVLVATTDISVILNATKAAVFEAVNATTVSPWAKLSVVDFFIKVIRGEFFGARKCKHNHSCGTGLKCDALWNWCTPLDAPEWQEFGNACNISTDCDELYYCALGKCKLAGPRPCLNSNQCINDISASITFDCLDIEDLEKRAVVSQLNRSTIKTELKPKAKKDKSEKENDDKEKADKADKRHHHHDHEVEIDSEEVATFGPTAEGDHLLHGKRCWARCIADKDCLSLRYPEVLLKENFACCSGYCTRKQSCVSVPEVFRTKAIATPIIALDVVKVIKI